MADPRQTTSTNDLINAMDSYISDNARSRDVDERWLASALIPIRDTSREVRNSRLSPDNKASRDAFRAFEIEKEMEGKRRELEALERDLKTLKPKAA